jgi:cell division protein FtsW (lipid II flippase)
VLGPVLVVWAVFVGVLVLETDLGTSLLFFGTFVLMLYVATQRTSWIVVGLLLTAAGAYAIGSVEPHVHQRIADWIHPFASANAGRGNSQLAESLFAFGAGGILGTGLGQGHSWLIGFAAKSDFILGTIGEELGLAGVMALFVLYALLVERGLRTAVAARDPFGKLLATGLSGGFALQVFVVAGGVTGLIPLTGMTLPFIAQGGSSVITNWALVAILLRISDSARRPAPAWPPLTDTEPTQVLRP